MRVVDKINSLLGDDLKASIHPKAKLKRWNCLLNLNKRQKVPLTLKK